MRVNCRKRAALGCCQPSSRCCLALGADLSNSSVLLAQNRSKRSSGMAINTQEAGQTADRRGRAAIPGLMATSMKEAGRRAVEPTLELFGRVLR